MRLIADCQPKQKIVKHTEKLNKEMQDYKGFHNSHMVYVFFFSKLDVYTS